MAEVKGLSVDEVNQQLEIDTVVFKKFGDWYPTQFRNENAIVSGPFVENFPLRNTKSKVHFIRPIKGAKENAFPSSFIMSEKYKFLITEGHITEVIVCDEKMECMTLNSQICSGLQDVSDPQLEFYDKQLDRKRSFFLITKAQAKFEKKDRLEISEDLKAQISQETKDFFKDKPFVLSEARSRVDKANSLCNDLKLKLENENEPNLNTNRSSSQQ